MSKVKNLKEELGREFDMNDLGAAQKIFGMEIFKYRKNGNYGLGLKQYSILLRCDSKIAIYLAKNKVYHARTKQICVWYHMV